MGEGTEGRADWRTDGRRATIDDNVLHRYTQFYDFLGDATHCISPIAIDMSVCLCVCASVCVCRVCELQENGLR